MNGKQIFLAKILIFIVLLSGFFALKSCNIAECSSGSGEIKEETRSLDEFENITLDCTGKVFIYQEAVQSVAIKTDANLLKYIKTSVSGKTLTISASKSICPTMLEFYLSAKNYKNFDLSGSGSIFSDGAINTGDTIKISSRGSGSQYFKSVASPGINTEILGSGNISVDNANINKVFMKIAGSGNININNAITAKIEASIDGSGNIKAGGSSSDAFLSIKGSGSIIMLSHKSMNCNAIISGSGSIFVDVTDFLIARISGSGDINYVGNPQLDVNITGSGKVVKLY